MEPTGVVRVTLQGPTLSPSCNPPSPPLPLIPRPPHGLTTKMDQKVHFSLKRARPASPPTAGPVPILSLPLRLKSQVAAESDAASSVRERSFQLPLRSKHAKPETKVDGGSVQVDDQVETADSDMSPAEPTGNVSNLTFHLNYITHTLFPRSRWARHEAPEDTGRRSKQASTRSIVRQQALAHSSTSLQQRVPRSFGPFLQTWPYSRLRQRHS